MSSAPLIRPLRQVTAFPATKAEATGVRYTLRQLEYFVAAADTGSIKSAAEQVSISQPSVSTAVAELERIFGVRLFVRRHARGLSLTPSGKALAREARLLLRQAEALERVLDDDNSTLRGLLSVGCLLTLAPMIIPELGRTFTETHNEVELGFVEGDPKELIDGIQSITIDVALTYDLAVPDDIQFEPLVSLKPHVLVARDHPLAGRRQLHVAELLDCPMVLLDLPHSRQYFMGLFDGQASTPAIGARSASQDVVRTLVANGYGFTIANVRPRNLVALDGRPLTSIPLADDAQAVTIGIMTLRQDRKPGLLTAFEAHCRTLINENGVPGMNLA